MQPTARRSLVRRLAPGVAALTTLALVGTGVAVAVSGQPRLSPVPSSPVTASLPSGGAADAGPCGPAAGTVRTCNLIASAGNVTLPGALPTDATITAPIWSFTTAGAPTVPVGPTLIALDNESITINVLNSLPGFAGNLAINVPGAATATSDSTGVASGGTATWTGSNLPAGTYIYEAGQLAVGSATDNAARQDAMGLVGTLVVRPHDFDQTGALTPRYALTGSLSSNGCLATGASGFTAEAMVQVSELSTEFNGNIAGGGHMGLAPYEPNYFLINGVPYHAGTGPFPQPTIDVAQGDCLLLRYADLGQSEHSMGTIGVRQTIIDENARPMIGATPRNLDAEYLTPGQTADSLVQVSANAHTGNQIPVVDVGRFLHNDLSTTASTPSLGGAAIAINVVTQTVAAALLGPSAQVSVTPATDSGAKDLTVNVTWSSAPTSANWFIDTVGGPLNGSFSGSSFVISHLMLDPLTNGGHALLDGDHIVWVQGTDTNGPGAPGGDVFTLNRTGPSIYALTIDPPVTNGATQNKPAVGLPSLVDTQYAAGVGTLNFGGSDPGLIVGDPIQILGLSPAAWDGNFTVQSVIGAAPLPPVVTGTFAAGTGTVDFGPNPPGLNIGDAIVLSGFTPDAWNGTFVVTGTSANTVSFSFGTTVTTNATAVGTASSGSRITFAFGPNDPLVNADQSVLPAPVVTGGAQQVSSDLLIGGTAEPSLADWVITNIHWNIDGGSTAGDVVYYDPSTPVPPNTDPAVGSPVAIAIDVPAASVAALTEGLHTVNITATETRYTSATLAGVTTYTLAEARTNTPAATITFVVDKTGPLATINSVTPDPAGEASNTSANINYYPSIRVKASITDASPIQSAELFMTQTGDPAPGTGPSPWKNGGGSQMTPDNAPWGGTLSAGLYHLDVYTDIPVAEFTAFNQGLARFWVHGQDAAGNWGTLTAVPTTATGANGVYDMQLDKTAPLILDGTTTPTAPAPHMGVPASLPSTFGTLEFTAQDPALPPPTPQNAGWTGYSGQLATVEWLISYTNVIDAATWTGTAIITPIPPQGVAGTPTVVDVPLASSPVPLATGAIVIYRIRDAAGNYSGFYETPLGV